MVSPLEVMAILETGILVGWIALDAYAYQKFWSKLQNLTEAVQGLQQEIHRVSPMSTDVDVIQLARPHQMQ